MPNYQRYPSMTNQRGDLVRRVTNLENEQGLIARIVALEIAVAALTPYKWITTSIKGAGSGVSPGLPSTGTAVMTASGGVLTPEAGGDTADEGKVSAYLSSMAATVDQDVRVDVDLGLNTGQDTVIGMYCADERTDWEGDTGYQIYGNPYIGYALLLWGAYGEFDMYPCVVQAWYDDWYGIPVADYQWAIDYTWPADRKISVRIRITAGTPTPNYSVKIWNQGDPEPAGWAFSHRMNETSTDDPDGSSGYFPIVTPGRLQLTVVCSNGTPSPVTFSNLVIS